MAVYTPLSAITLTGTEKTALLTAGEDPVGQLTGAIQAIADANAILGQISKVLTAASATGANLTAINAAVTAIS